MYAQNSEEKKKKEEDRGHRGHYILRWEITVITTYPTRRRTANMAPPVQCCRQALISRKTKPSLPGPSYGDRKKYMNEKMQRRERDKANASPQFLIRDDGRPTLEELSIGIHNYTIPPPDLVPTVQSAETHALRIEDNERYLIHSNETTPPHKNA